MVGEGREWGGGRRRGAGERRESAGLGKAGQGVGASPLHAFQDRSLRFYAEGGQCACVGGRFQAEATNPRVCGRGNLDVVLLGSCLCGGPRGGVSAA